jgi:hypothetical protein
VYKYHLSTLEGGLLPFHPSHGSVFVSQCARQIEALLIAAMIRELECGESCTSSVDRESSIVVEKKKKERKTWRQPICRLMG